MPNTQPTILLIVRGLKSDLPQDEMERRYKERMPDFRNVPGLVQKYYSCDEKTGSGPASTSGTPRSPSRRTWNRI